MNVLIADDDPVSRRLLDSYLRKWGHEVAVAHNGLEAWALFEHGDYPIVITDWMMPDMDGVELIRRIRASARSEFVYTILLTARAQKEDLVEGMDAGADDFVTKPFDRDELRVRLREGVRIVSLERRLDEQDRFLRTMRDTIDDVEQAVAKIRDTAIAENTTTAALQQSIAHAVDNIRRMRTDVDTLMRGEI